MNKPTREEVEWWYDEHQNDAPAEVFEFRLCEAYLALLDENEMLREQLRLATYQVRSTQDE